MSQTGPIGRKGRLLILVILMIITFIFAGKKKYHIHEVQQITGAKALG